MMVAVVCLNLVLALIGFYLAWRLWHLRQVLARTTGALDQWQQEVRLALVPVPVVAQTDVAFLRRQYRRLQQQLHLLRLVWRVLVGVAAVVQRWPQVWRMPSARLPRS